VLELETDELAGTLADLQGKVTVEDPYIKALRVARNRPGIVRVVLDLKQTVNAQVFTLKPVGEYGYRLVLDLHPLVAVDPLAELLKETNEEKRANVKRLATIAIDAGHGGEDPGAIGRKGTREKDITLVIARRLKALIDAEPSMRALLTRNGDYFLELRDRVKKARDVRADLLVSIHADSFVRRDARGSSVYALSERRASSEGAPHTPHLSPNFAPAVVQFLDEIDPDAVSSKGTALGSAVRTALKAFDGGSGASKAVLLITDGEDTTGQAQLAA